MPIRSSVLLGLFILPWAAPAFAVDSGYQAIKQDPGFFVGEGSASLGDHNGDPLETERAARVAARAALAEAIEVRISVITTDVIVAGSAAAQESLSSKSRSVSVVELANVRTRTYTDLPRQGDITVLAILAKDDYRRLLGGRLDDSPHGALDLFVGGQALIHAGDLSQALGQGSTSAPMVLQPGFELSFGPWVGGFSAFAYDLNGGNWDPRELTFTPGAGAWTGHMQLFRANVGYNWLLGKRRWQPYVPLRAECQWLSISEVGSGIYPGVAGGLGLHYWFNNNLALDLRGLWHQGFQGPATLKDPRDPSGGPLMLFPPRAVTLNLDGPELAVAILVTD